MIRERDKLSIERDHVVDMAAATPVLTTDDLDAVRHLVLTHLDAGIASWTIEKIAREATMSVEPLRVRFGRAERIVDEVVAGELRRARPVVTNAVDGEESPPELISELVHRRLLVDDRIRRVWHLIGQGEASSQEFDALRATLLADVGIRIENRLDHLQPLDRIEAVRIVDGALSLAAVRSLRRDATTSFDQVAAHLHADVEQLLDGLEFGAPGQRSPRLIIMQRGDAEAPGAVS